MLKKVILTSDQHAKPLFASPNTVFSVKFCRLLRKKMLKCWKRWFWPSDQHAKHLLLVQIHNTHSGLRVGSCIEQHPLWRNYAFLWGLSSWGNLYTGEGHYIDDTQTGHMIHETPRRIRRISKKKLAIFLLVRCALLLGASCTACLSVSSGLWPLYHMCHMSINRSTLDTAVKKKVYKFF